MPHHATSVSIAKVVIGATVAAFLTGLPSIASASAFEITLLKASGTSGNGGGLMGSGGGGSGSGGGSNSLGIGGGSMGGGGISGGGGARGIISEAKSAVAPQPLAAALDDVVALDLGPESDALVVSGPPAAAITSALNGASLHDTNAAGSVANPVNGLAAAPSTGPLATDSGNYTSVSSTGGAPANHGSAVTLPGNPVLPNAPGSFDSSALSALVSAIAPEPSGAFADSSPSATAEAVPASEPGALFLLGAGLILAARRVGARRRTR
jgi:hypothetical protein